MKFAVLSVSDLVLSGFLKPSARTVEETCPFCRQRVGLYYEAPQNTGRWFVVCMPCRLTVGPWSSWGIALKNWRVRL